MTEPMQKAIDTANNVVGKIPDDELSRIRKKLIDAATYNERDTLITMLLNLSARSGVNFDFVNGLLSDYESNKTLLYCFLNELMPKPKK